MPGFAIGPSLAPAQCGYRSLGLTRERRFNARRAPILANIGGPPRFATSISASIAGIPVLRFSRRTHAAWLAIRWH
jgi:hypothetical protein